MDPATAASCGLTEEYVVNLLKTRTVLGAVLAVIGYLAQPEVLAVLPAKVASVVTAIGLVLSAIGVRAAIEKSGPAQ